jgi:hypothetical protein
VPDYRRARHKPHVRRAQKALEIVRQRGCAIEDEESEWHAPHRGSGSRRLRQCDCCDHSRTSVAPSKALTAFIPHVIETAADFSATWLPAALDGVNAVCSAGNCDV